MGRPKKRVTSEDKVVGISIRCSPEWRDWVNALAEHRRLKVPDIVDQALLEYAEKHAFKERPPKRS